MAKVLILVALLLFPTVSFAATISVEILGADELAGTDNSFTITDNFGDLVAAETAIAPGDSTFDYDLSPGIYTFAFFDSGADGFAFENFFGNDGVVSVLQGSLVLGSIIIPGFVSDPPQPFSAGGAFEFTVSTVPVPAALPLLAAALAALGFFGWIRSRSA